MKSNNRHIQQSHLPTSLQLTFDWERASGGRIEKKRSVLCLLNANTNLEKLHKLAALKELRH